MNCKKILTASLAVAGALFGASSAHAQANQFMIGVGSSALFPSVTLSEVTTDPITTGAAPCGTNVWTGKNGSAAVVALGVDPRVGPANEPGTISVVWNTAAANAGNPIPPNSGAVICVYLSVDSIVGQRLYFAQGAAGNGTLNFNDAGAVGGKQVAGIDDSATTVPAGVTAAINGAHFTHAYTDIRPEDGEFAYFRAAGAQPSPYAPGPFGYNPANNSTGTRIFSSFSGSFAQVIPFSIAGNDPLNTQFAIPTAITVPIGASPVLVIVNSDISLGNATNILSKTAAKLFSGQLGDPQAVFGKTVVTSSGLILSQMQREPLSGTYNTFEFQVVHARDGSSDDTQERSPVSSTGLINPTPTTSGCPGGGLTPPVAFTVGQLGCTNPMFINSQQNSIRYRAVGTGEMIKAVDNGLGAENTLVVGGAKGDNIGYAFYSFGSFFINKANLKYLQLQGLDALYAAYNTGGKFTAGAGCTGSIVPGANLKCDVVLPTFTNILNGSYRAWSLLRVVETQGAGINTLINSVITAAQDQSAFALKNPVAANTTISAIADWVPVVNANTTGNTYTPFTFAYFRSHYPLTLGARTFNPNNGTSATFCSSDQLAAGLTAPCPENGGDMAGVAYQITTDQLFDQYNAGSFLFTQIE
jgi:hypothetical protein